MENNSDKKEELKLIQQAREIIQYGGGVVFTGAGISVESGIPPFRGPTGLWSRYNPEILDITFFRKQPEVSWKYIKEIFYDHFQQVEPNYAHRWVAKLEQSQKIFGVITQNIDNLHQRAGSRAVVEFHGTAYRLVCLDCTRPYDLEEVSLEKLPPICPKCGGVLKPDFVFFGESIPPASFRQALNWVEKCNFLLIIGTSGEILPAGRLPFWAKENGASIIEINIQPSTYTSTITDIFLNYRATKGAQLLAGEPFRKK